MIPLNSGESCLGGCRKLLLGICFWNSRILLWRWTDDFCGWIYAVDIICCWKLAKVWNELPWIGPGLKDGSFNGEKSRAKMYSRKFLEIAGFSWVATFFRTFTFVEALPIGILFFNRKSKTKVGYESAFYVEDMGHSAIYIMSNICYTIILWNSTLSTILKHSKSRNNQKSPCNNFPPNLAFSSLLQGVNVHGLFLEGAGWEDGKGEDEARPLSPREKKPRCGAGKLGSKTWARMRVVGWDARIHPRCLFNKSPLKNDGWKTILSFWGPGHFQGRTVKLPGSNSQEISNRTYVSRTPKAWVSLVFLNFFRSKLHENLQMWRVLTDGEGTWKTRYVTNTSCLRSHERPPDFIMGLKCFKTRATKLKKGAIGRMFPNHCIPWI